MGATTYYFAYGSNMHVGRILARIPEASPIEAAILEGHELKFHKRGRDGSAKCSVAPDATQRVAGVVYRVLASALLRLDRIEGPGYRRGSLVVSGARSGRSYRAHCYAAKAHAIDEACIAFDWYRDIIVAGAEAHDLPVDYVDRLRGVPAQRDPNGRRHRRHVALLTPRGRFSRRVARSRLAA